MRGFTLDNRFNYRREGLPINAETTIPLDNKERIEILKGTSGIQAGTSAPGGLVNLLVKRPNGSAVRDVGFEERAAYLLARRPGRPLRRRRRVRLAAQRRARAAAIRCVRASRRRAQAWPAATRLARSAATRVLEGEFEWSRKSQPSQAGFSLLGNTLPAPPRSTRA